METSPEFQEFWLLYPPNNASEYATAQVYDMIIMQGADHHEIIAGTKRYVDYIHLKGIKREYIACADNWLKNRKWTVQYTAIVAPRMPAQSALRKMLPWEERAMAVRGMVREYLKLFFLSPQGVQARREGWDHQLYRYVAAVAYIQAQYIHKCPSVGYEGAIIFDNTPTDGEELYLINSCKSQAERGMINVRVPADKIAQWKMCFAPSSQIPIPAQTLIGPPPIAQVPDSSISDIDDGW